jgi:hypothetical protein
MRKLSNFLSGLAGAVLGSLVLAAASVWAVPTTLPLPAIPVPYLGDFGNNLSTLTQSYLAGSGHGTVNLGSVSQTNTQAACTPIGPANDSKLYVITTSASTGSVCLPTANAGKEVIISNASASTVNLYGSNIFAVPGTQDTINGSAGNNPYNKLITLMTAICVAPVTGKWNCGAFTN